MTKLVEVTETEWRGILRRRKYRQFMENHRIKLIVGVFLLVWLLGLLDG